MAHSSRRIFISNVAILSAGAALSATPRFNKLLPQANDKVQQLWRSFCSNFKAGTRLLNPCFDLAQLPLPCKGHLHKTGKPVFFGEQVFAVPVWIHWNTVKQCPDDLLVVFFEGIDQPEKLTCFNRFEVKASLLAHDAATNILSANTRFYSDSLAQIISKQHLIKVKIKDTGATIAYHVPGLPQPTTKTVFHI